MCSSPLPVYLMDKDELVTCDTRGNKDPAGYPDVITAISGTFLHLGSKCHTVGCTVSTCVQFREKPTTLVFFQSACTRYAPFGSAGSDAVSLRCVQCYCFVWGTAMCSTGRGWLGEWDPYPEFSCKMNLSMGGVVECWWSCLS